MAKENLFKDIGLEGDMKGSRKAKAVQSLYQGGVTVESVHVSELPETTKELLIELLEPLTNLPQINVLQVGARGKMKDSISSRR